MKGSIEFDLSDKVATSMVMTVMQGGAFLQGEGCSTVELSPSIKLTGSHL